MVSRSQRVEKRHLVDLTDQEVADVLWAANQGAEQVFGYTDPQADWEMTPAEFERWEHRVNSAIHNLAQSLGEGGFRFQVGEDITHLTEGHTVVPGTEGEVPDA